MGKVPVDKPPRTSSTMTTVTSNASSGKSLSHSRSGNVPVSSLTQKKMVSGDDYDHHTLATATTASATISYSTDQGDDASEMGMEVIMSSSSVDQHHHINHHHHHHSHVLGSSGKLGTANVVTVEPYTSHSFLAGKHTFTVDRRYSMIRTIGSGAYGVVISALDAKHGQNVAIKMVPKAFSDEIDAKRILREIKLLKHFRHDNIVSLIDMMPPNVQYLEDFNDVYLVTDLMETDLHRIIYSKQKLSIDHAQYFIYQVLRGLKYIHSCRVLHRDLKPSNLLVNSNCDLKICDFGLARGIRRDPNDPIDSGNSGSDSTTDPMLLTEYVVTRWYRAPEIMLACHEYSYPIDMWSVGCIFAELILRKPYFPGDDYIDQVCPKKYMSLFFLFFVEIVAF
jgi:mitogen-activated protein kinase 1/3